MLGGVGVLSVRVVAVGVLLVLVPRGVLVLLPRRRGLLPPPLLLLPRLGGRGRSSSVVGAVAGEDLGVRGRHTHTPGRMTRAL